MNELRNVEGAKSCQTERAHRAPSCRATESGCEILDDDGTSAFSDRAQPIDVCGVAVLVCRNKDVAGAKDPAKVRRVEIEATGAVVHGDDITTRQARGFHDRGAGIGRDNDAASIKGRREREKNETQGPPAGGRQHNISACGRRSEASFKFATCIARGSGRQGGAQHVPETKVWCEPWNHPDYLPHIAQECQTPDATVVAT
jgi:hypothetical protein